MSRQSRLRAASLACALGLSLGVARLLNAFVPAAPPLAIVGIAFAALALAGAFAVVAGLPALRSSAPWLAAAAVMTNAAPFATREAAAVSLAFALASLAALLAILVVAVRDARRRPIPSADIAAALALAAVLAAVSAYRLLASQEVMFSDFMACRLLSIEVARAIRAVEIPALITVFAKSVSSEYFCPTGRWAPAITGKRLSPPRPPEP